MLYDQYNRPIIQREIPDMWRDVAKDMGYSVIVAPEEFDEMDRNEGRDMWWAHSIATRYLTYSPKPKGLWPKGKDPVSLEHCAREVHNPLPNQGH